jgi:hypothetical protein
MFPWGSQVGSLNESLGWSNHGSDQPKVKYLAEQISPNGTKYDRQIMETHKAAVMS